MALRIHIDREACIGAQSCVYWAPGVFEIDGEGLAVVVDPGAAADDKILEAVRNCPTGAIEVTSTTDLTQEKPT